MGHWDVSRRSPTADKAPAAAKRALTTDGIHAKLTICSINMARRSCPLPPPDRRASSFFRSCCRFGFAPSIAELNCLSSLQVLLELFGRPLQRTVRGGPTSSSFLLGSDPRPRVARPLAEVDPRSAPEGSSGAFSFGLKISLNSAAPSAYHWGTTTAQAEASFALDPLRFSIDDPSPSSRRPRTFPSGPAPPSRTREHGGGGRGLDGP